MFGAIIGDVVGSVFEFDRGPWTKDFKLLSSGSTWTDDTVMTIAVGEAHESGHQGLCHKGV